MANDVELSEREREILRLVATGASNKEIAQTLTISANTVKVHLRNIFAKIEVASRTEATLYAIRAGLVPTPVEAGSASLPVEVDLAGDVAMRSGNGHSDAALLPAEQTPPQPRLRPWTAMVFFSVIILAGLIFGAQWMTHSGVFTPTPLAVNATPDLTRWKDLADLPTPRSGLAAVAYESQVYAIGGESAAGVTGLMDRYDPTTDSWEALAPKPLAISDVQAALLGEKIYVPGGITADGTISDQMEVYNPRRGTWEEKAALPAPRSAYALAAYEGRLYLFGGWDGSKVVDTVFEYDPVLDTWAERSAMPTARTYAAAAEAGGKIHIVGGSDGVKPLAVNEVYYPQRDQDGEPAWENAAALPEPRSHLALAGLADVLYAFGGQAESAGQAQRPLGYLSDTGAWQELENPPQPVGEQAAVVVLGNYLDVFGGKIDGEPEPGFQSYQAIFTVVLPYIQ